MPLEFWSVYWTFVAFAYGAIVGSFLNVCIWRLPRGASVAHPPSHCPACEHQLRLFPDMVPMLSQLWYRSRCRYCGTQFSWRYLWVELFTAVMFAAVYVRYGLSPNDGPGWIATVSAICAMAFVAALIVVFFIDLEHYIIHDSVVAVAAAAGVVKDGVLIAAGLRPLWQDLPGTGLQIPVPLSLLVGAASFWLLWQFAALCTALLSKEAMGGGDSVLLGALGAFLLPWPLVALAFGIAITLGAVGGLIGMWRYSRRPSQPVVPAATVEAVPDREGEEQGVHGEEQLLDGVIAESAAVPDPPAPAPTELELPRLPAASRWGRLACVLASWLVVLGVWGGAVLWERSALVGVATGAVGLMTAAGLLRYGLRAWRAGDEVWLPEMDQVFEGDPGPRVVPFGPYLVAGTFIAMLFGREICERYATSVLMMPPEAFAALGWR